VNLTYVAEENYENVNPTVFWSTVNDRVHVLWMQDQEPGSSLENEAPDPITTDNDILYRAFEYSRFEPYDPTADYAYVTAANLVTFDNLSVDASSYSWSFGDGGSSSLKEPSHVYAEVGDYLVCLTAVNVYGDDQSCKTIQITEVLNVDEVALEQDIHVYPTLTTGTVTITLDQFHPDLIVGVYDMQGRLITTTALEAGSASLDLSAQAAGNYVLKFVSHSAVVIKQVSLVR
jgi:PKD repeat protein